MLGLPALNARVSPAPVFETGITALLDASSSIFNRFALLYGDVSVISIISTASIVITILASRFILKEKITWKKYLMILGIFICVLILAIIK